MSNDFSLDMVRNLEETIKTQRNKLSEMQKLLDEIEFIPIEPVMNYSSISYKAIDGGKMNIFFDPFEIQYVEIADSNENILLKYIMPKSEGIDAGEHLKELENTDIFTNFLSIFDANRIKDISEISSDPQKIMELSEYACIFYKIMKSDKYEKYIIMKDGLLRTKSLKHELISSLLSILKEKDNMKLVGVSKTSKLLSMMSAALHLNKKFPLGSIGYIEVPLKVELMAYKWSGAGKIKGIEPLKYGFGKLYVAKLAPYSNLLVTIEIPYDHENNEPIYNREEIDEIIGHLAKDSKTSYPNIGYPQTIMRAHEKAVKIGFTASVMQEKIMNHCLEGLSDKFKRDIKDYNFTKPKVNKGTIGGI